MSDDEMTIEDWDEMTALWDSTIWPLLDERKVAEAIDHIQGILNAETKAIRRWHLFNEMSTLLMLDGRDDESLSAIRQCIDLRPDDPLGWHGLASWYFYGTGFYDAGEDTLKRALDAIDIAVEKARVRGDLRFALNDRCRIAIAMKRYDLLEESLREILAMPPDTPGIQLEGDFLPRIPDGAIDQSILGQYRAALAEQEARRAERPPSD